MKSVSCGRLVICWDLMGSDTWWYVRGPWDPLQFQWFSRRNHWKTFTLMLIIYSKRIQICLGKMSFPFCVGKKPSSYCGSLSYVSPLLHTQNTSLLILLVTRCVAGGIWGEVPHNTKWVSAIHWLSYNFNSVPTLTRDSVRSHRSRTQSHVVATSSPNPQAHFSCQSQSQTSTSDQPALNWRFNAENQDPLLGFY